VTVLALDLDAVLGDTGPLLEAWLDEASRRFRIEREAAQELGNWQALLERFAEEHAPVYLRPDGEANAAVRRLRAAGARLGAFTGAPEPLARIAVAQLGIGRHLDALEAGAGSLERLLGRLGSGANVVHSREQLLEFVR
jgi:phosphoglycolate phosphatase-like HAD superfamily hydrolase